MTCVPSLLIKSRGNDRYLWNAPPGLQRWRSSSSSRTDSHDTVHGRSRLWRSYPAASRLCLWEKHCIHWTTESIYIDHQLVFEPLQLHQSLNLHSTSDNQRTNMGLNPWAARCQIIQQNNDIKYFPPFKKRLWNRWSVNWRTHVSLDVTLGLGGFKSVEGETLKVN